LSPPYPACSYFHKQEEKHRGKHATEISAELSVITVVFYVVWREKPIVRITHENVEINGAPKKEPIGFKSDAHLDNCF